MAYHPELVPENTNFEYIGDESALGSLQLTMLARSYEQIEQGSLEDLFPSRDINERTIVVEQRIEGLAISPIVRMGVPAGNFAENARVQSRRFSPAMIREDDFLDQGYINQLRKPGTYNDQYQPTDIIADRVQQMINRRARTLAFFRAQVLLGGINYYDPRTNQSLDVATNIPEHNYFHYNGVDATLNTLAVGATIPNTVYSMGPYNSTKVVKGRRDAMLFTDAQSRAGIPWSDPQADIVRACRLIKQFLFKTNKNQFVEIVMNSDLYTLLHENLFIKAYSGSLGVFGNNTQDNSGGLQISQIAPAGVRAPANAVSFGPGGDLQAIAGLRIRLIDGLFRHPETNTITNYWPGHKVAIVAPRHYQDATSTLGFTHHCVAESPEGTPGLWMRSGPEQQPPSPPGRTMQMGDAFLPFAVYPHWIAILDVCEPSHISQNLIINQMEHFGTF